MVLPQEAGFAATHKITTIGPAKWETTAGVTKANYLTSGEMSITSIQAQTRNNMALKDQCTPPP